MASQVTVTAQDHPTTPACAASDTPNGKNTKSAEKVSISHGEDTVQELQHTCETCGEVFTHARLLKRHLATEQAGKQFPCSLCGAVYLRLACLNVHVRTHTVVCNQCLISFISESSYRRHTCKPSDEIVFDCKNCGKEFRQRDGLLQHIVQSHVTENGFACEDCGKDMPTAAYLARHKKSCAAQAAKSFSCPECDAIFRSLSGLRLHLLSHAGAKPYTCLECGASFKAQTYLSCHIKRKHCKDRPFSCMHCSKAFPFQSALNLHMKSHHPESKDQIKLQTERSFRKTSSGTVDRQQKGVVEAVFDKSLSLSLPEESRDLSTTNVPAVGSVDCQLQRCFTAVSSRSQSLITGEEIVVPASTADDTSRIGDAGWDVEPANNAPSVWQDNDGMAESPVNVLVDFCTQEVPVVQLQAFDIGQSGRSPPESDETLQQEFQHVCKTCGESFAHARLLKRHLYIEQEGKEFSCSLWGAVFLRLACLNVHMRTHTIVCDKCNVAFISESSCKKHACKPPCENVFECKNCGEKYKHRSELLEHIQTHVINSSCCICEDCGKEMPTATYLARHKKSCAAQGARYSCPECEAIFRSLSGLRLHLLSHAGEKPYACLECGASFKVQAYLSCHIKRKHCRERPFACNICTIAFPFQSALNVHLKSHHLETKKKDKARKRYTEKTSEGKLPDNSEVSGQTEDTVELETVFGESQGKFPPLTEDAQFPTSDRDREGRGEPEQELEWSSDVLSVHVENDSGVNSGLDDLTGAPRPGDDRETEEATTEEQETSDDRETEEATTEEQETSDDRETEEATTEEQETSDDRETEEATTEEQETSDDRETEEATTEEQETSDDRETEEATTEEQETSDDRETEEATTEEQETSDDRETEEATTEEQETSDTNLISTPELDRNDSETEKHHVCETCGEVYSTAHLLTRHQRIQWEGDQYPCYLCDAVFPRTSCLRVHLRDHTFVCEQCQVVFVSQSSLKEHTCDCSRKTYECKKCKKECKERVELDEHIQTHITEHNHVCEYCGKQLPTATYLTRHKKSCATQSAKFACPKCKTMSGSLMSLRSHMKEKHTSDRSFFCTFCGKGFALKHRLDSHQKIHIDHRKRRAVVETHIRGQARRTKRRCPETSSNDAWDGFTRTKASPERKAMGKEGNGDKRDQDVESEMSDGLLESSLPWTQSETTKSTPVTISQADFDGSGEGPHTCGTCGATFQRAFLLKRHLDTRQEGRRFPCSLCEQVFPRSGCLHVHMQNHSFVCEQCQIVFITEISFRNHLCKGSEGNTYQCQKCAEVFRYQAALAEHIETHITEKGCICRKCGKELASAGYMERHKKTCGVKTSKFSCPQCEELFRTIRGLRLHLQSHSGVKPFTCELCGISFKAQQYLQCHKKQIHSSDRPFLCSQCPKAFAFKHRLNAHMKEHTSAGQHICQQCGSSFKTAEGLKCHLETHSDARPYICTECGRGFKQRTVLIRHVMTHTGVRGYKCRFCDAAFVHMSSLCRHERTHTGDRPYICKICSASFPDSGTLVIHRRLHTGEKPYVCSFCAMRFSDPSSMRKHVRGKHGVEKPVCRTEKSDDSAYVQVTLNDSSSFKTAAGVSMV